MLKKLILFLIFLLIAPRGHAENYYKFMYKTEDGESFSSILRRFVKENSIINAKTPLVKKTRKYNPHIKEWSKIPADSIIELYISNNFMDLEKYYSYEKETLKKLTQKDQKSNPSYPSGMKGSIFYMASLGIFTQSSDSVAEINFKQNSPLSLGTAFTYYPKDKMYSTSFSAYFSQLLASANTLTTSKISVPPEIGGNIYEEYRFQKLNTTFYTGLDYESFSTFNLTSIQNEQQLYVDKVSAIYLTIGMAKSFFLFNQQFFTKISASRSITTTYSSGAPASSTGTGQSIDTGLYSGYRFLFYLNYKLNKKFYLHSLFKYHTMTGPSNLTTIRIGVGLGYILF